MGKRKFFFSVLLLFLVTSLAFAQKGEVTGVIKDAGTGEPIPYASVMVKGTMIGVSAGPDGSYSISVPDKSKSILMFSSVGYKDMEVKINGRSIIDVNLRVENVLQDVVIVAYGSQKKESVTGSVSSVKGDGLAKAAVTSVDKMLTGKLAGVNVSVASGQPGAFSSIRIRGTGSINAGAEPLWVIDGIPIEVSNTSTITTSGNTLSMLNVNDIENITVLKDAAAASAYGSRAANGVILITTKSGRAGHSQFDARAKFGINWLHSDTGYRSMNAEELLGFYRQATINAGLDPDDPSPNNPYYFPMSILDKPRQNWFNELIKVGKTQEYEISGRGGNSKSTFYSSVIYQKNDGIFYGSSYDKLLGRINTSYKLLDNLELSARLSLGYTNSQTIPTSGLYYSNPIFAAQTLLPWIPAKVDGKWNLNIPSNSNENPRATAEYNDYIDEEYLGNNIISFKWSPLKSLVFESKNAMQFRFGQGRQFVDPQAYGSPKESYVIDTYRRNIRLTTSNTMTYSNLFQGVHSLRVVLGQEAFTERFRAFDVRGNNVNIDIPYILTSDYSKTTLGQDISNETLLSYFLISDYNYDNRYFLQANVRLDGSSLFGSANRWGLFWSVAGSWNITRESFWTFDKVNLLKMRLSYGVNGNNSITNYRAFGLYDKYTYNGFTGFVPSQPANPTLSWEKNKTWNFGVDFGVLDNRINGNIDIYNRITDGMLLDDYVPWTSGWGSVFKNIGSLQNKGIELQLNIDIIRNQDIQWSIGGNISMNRSKVLKLAGQKEIGKVLKIVEGRQFRTFYLYDYYGVNPSNGEALWVHEDEKGNTSLTNNAALARLHYCGSPEPKYIGGFNTQIEWKGFSLSTFCEFKGGHKVYMPDELRYLNADGNIMELNQLADALNYWKKPGDIGVHPKPIAGNNSNSYQFNNDRWLFDGSYLRIKDVTLSYSIPQLILKKINLKGLRVYVSGINLYCFNDVYDFDPEKGNTGQTTSIYPFTKSIVGGLEISF